MGSEGRALWIRGGTLCDGTGMRKGDLVLRAGKIEAELPPGTPYRGPAGGAEIDAGGCYVLPGLVDAHVHFYMQSGPIRTADDFAAGSRGALAGGVTSVIDFARPLPGRPLIQGLEARKREAERGIQVDYALHMGLQGWYVRQGAVNFKNLSEVRRAGVSSVKLFTTYGESRVTRDELEALFSLLRRAKLLPMVHAEQDQVCLQAAHAAAARGMTGPRFHGQLRPRQAEIQAIQMLLALCRTYRLPIYIAHVSTAEGAELIRRARRDGLQVMGETCPHYLLKTSACYDRPEAELVVASPPLRNDEDCQALFEALGDGTLQCVASDHCAFSRAQKQAAAWGGQIPAGISGVETLLPLLYTYGVTTGRLSMTQLVRITSEQPAYIFGMFPQKGSLSPGSDADVIVLDPRCGGSIHADELYSKSGFSIFEGMPVSGKCTMAIRRGEIAFIRGEKKHLSDRIGKFIQQNHGNFI